MSTRTSRSKCGGLAFAAYVLLCTVPAFAVDGEVLINQAKVNAGGITPGDAAGFPATLSRPGRYKLTGNLVVPASNTAIQITANDVTVDLNGFTISGAVPGSAARGIFAGTGVDRSRIANGTVTGFNNYGILTVGLDAAAENMRIVGNDIGMQLGSQARVSNSTIANNSTGMYCYQCLIESNIIAGNTNAGIFDSNGGGGMVLGNVIVGNTSYGVVAPDPPLPKTGYANNILIGNNGGGVQGLGITQAHPNVCEPACP
jgi:hypothetical protein